MKRSRFTEEQIIGMLKEHHPATVAGLGFGTLAVRLPALAYPAQAGGYLDYLV